MSIPVENIYYLLCYAWNKLEEKELVNVSAKDVTKLQNLFARVLISAARLLLKRGIDRSYIPVHEEVAGIQGKLLYSETVKRNLHLRQRTVCYFDDFSMDILSNQILVTTLYKLIKTNGVNNRLKRDIVSLLRMLPGISRIKIDASVFKKVRLNRNNKFYGFVLNICQLIHESLLPTEEEGCFTFMDFTRDEKKMPYLFENFVRNFYAIEQNIYYVGRERIDWNFEFDDSLDISKEHLPAMQTDITLENKYNKIIIDAKFYKETLTSGKVKSVNLYQLFSYIVNQREDDKTRQTTGILLYPTIEKEYDLDYKFKDHIFKIRTVNLNDNWQNISDRLKAIIKE